MIDLLKESESEHGDKTYLVRTDLAGQVGFHICKRVENYFSLSKGCPDLWYSYYGGLPLQFDAKARVGRHGRAALQVGPLTQVGGVVIRQCLHL